jgi:hypothetical protein
LKKVLSRVNIYYIKIKTEKYEKDDIFNVYADFIYLYSNVRTINYKLKEKEK